METPVEREYFSFGDALFLYFERDCTPLNIASVAVFDGVITREQMRRYVASKLPRIPRYMQKVVFPPLNVGLPSWEFDQDFDIDNHIHQRKLRHGTESELKTVASHILSRPLDRAHPLWDFTVLPGFEGKKTALIARVHHCMADGMSGVGILNAVMDTTDKVLRLPKIKKEIPKPPRYAPGSVGIDAALHSWFSTVERMLKAGSEILATAQRLTQSPGSEHQNSEPASASSLQEFARVMPQLGSLPDRLPFNTLCQGPQNFDWTEVSFEEMRAIKKKTGTTINDVLLALLTSTFRRYARSSGVELRGRSLRIVVPVNTRREHEMNALGNHITFVPVDTPLDIAEMDELLAAVHERMLSVKSARVGEIVAFAGMLMGALPSPIQATLAPMIANLNLSLCNTICTNVPGPQYPLYLLGHKMLRAYPIVPIGGEMGINVAMLTYDGMAYFGFLGDAKAAPHLATLPKFLDAAMRELKSAVGIRTEPSRSKRAVRKRAVAPQQPAAQDAEEAPKAKVAVSAA